LRQLLNGGTAEMGMCAPQVKCSHESVRVEDGVVVYEVRAIHAHERVRPDEGRVVVPVVEQFLLPGEQTPQRRSSISWSI